MEVKISVAEILKDKPQGTKLYANAFGELSIEDICAEEFKTKFKQLLNETKQRFQKEFDEL